MPVLLSVAVAVAVVLLAAVAVALRRVRDELDPTIRSFEHFRAALAPVIAGLHDDARRTRAALPSPPAGSGPPRK